MFGGAAFDPFAWWGRVDPPRVAVVDRERAVRLSYGEMDALIGRWAAMLATRGVAPGDRVASLAGNRVEQVALLYACARVRASLVPLNWRLAAPELERIVRGCRPCLTIGDAKRRVLAESSGIERFVDFDAEAPRLLSAVEPLVGAYAAQSSDVAMILYTSGSTGEPKGVMIPHRQLLANAIATAVGWELDSTDVAPVATPFFHTGGWNVVATPLWVHGGRVVLFDQYDPAAYLEGLADERCTVALTIPTQMTMLLESPAWGLELPAMRWFISGGAPCPPAVMARVRAAGFAMKEGYGLTECGPNCFAVTIDESMAHPGSVGRPVPMLEARVLRDDGSSCDADEPGELCLRGPQRFDGYFENPEQTARAIDGDGFLHTGDLVSRDADGRYVIRGRKKDMFISGGENVYPGEVEAVFSEHPAVADVAVVGVPDPKWGEVGRAFVVLRAGAAATPDELRQWARARLAGYKVPKDIGLRRELPRLGSGKVDRGALATLGVDA